MSSSNKYTHNRKLTRTLFWLLFSLFGCITAITGLIIIFIILFALLEWSGDFLGKTGQGLEGRRGGQKNKAKNGSSICGRSYLTWN